MTSQLFIYAMPLASLLVMFMQFRWITSFVRLQRAVAHLQDNDNNREKVLNAFILSDKEYFKSQEREWASFKSKISTHASWIEKLRSLHVDDMGMPLISVVSLKEQVEKHTQNTCRLGNDISTIFSRLDALEKPSTTAALSDLAKAISKPKLSLRSPAISAASSRKKNGSGGRHVSR